MTTVDEAVENAGSATDSTALPAACRDSNTSRVAFTTADVIDGTGAPAMPNNPWTRMARFW